MTRPLRDLLAEALWLEPGILRRSWQDWDQIAPDETERVRCRADVVIRLLQDRLGVGFIIDGESQQRPIPQSPEVWRYRLPDHETERVVRRGPGDVWQIATIKAGAWTVEIEFTLFDALASAGAVLCGDPSAGQIKGLGRILAALATIYSVYAEKMEAPQP